MRDFVPVHPPIVPPAAEPGPDLVETMAFDPVAGIAQVEEHLARLKAGSAELGFAFDRHATRNELQAATFRLRDAATVRLAVARSGATAIQIDPAVVAPAKE